MLNEKQYDSMKENLPKKADEIGNWGAKVKECRAMLEALDIQKREIQGIQLLDVAMETEPIDPKKTDLVPRPKFTNENTRKAEVSKRLSQDPSYQKLLSEERQVNSDLLNAEIEHDRAEKKFDALKVVAGLYEVEMRLKAELRRPFDQENR